MKKQMKKSISLSLPHYGELHRVSLDESQIDRFVLGLQNLAKTRPLEAIELYRIIFPHLSIKATKLNLKITH